MVFLGKIAAFLKYAFIYDSPIGELLLVADEKTLLYLGLSEGFPSYEEISFTPNTVLNESKYWLDQYFMGNFSAPLPKLFQKTTAFRKKVYEVLLNIPVGKTLTYGELAKKIGNPNAARAVGAACARNQLPLFIPCHRVLGQKNKLLYTLGGAEAKRFLLKLEKAIF